VNTSVIAVKRKNSSAGAAHADFKFVMNVLKKIDGELVTGQPGFAQTVKEYA
jgi:hypothetical protein